MTDDIIAADNYWRDSRTHKLNIYPSYFQVVKIARLILIGSRLEAVIPPVPSMNQGRASVAGR